MGMCGLAYISLPTRHCNSRRLVGISTYDKCPINFSPNVYPAAVKSSPKIEASAVKNLHFLRFTMNPSLVSVLSTLSVSSQHTPHLHYCPCALQSSRNALAVSTLDLAIA